MNERTARKQLSTAKKPRRELSFGFDHAGTLISDFHPPELWENKFALLKKHPDYGTLL